MKTVILLLLVGLVCTSGAKPRGQQSRAPHLDHELTNRVLHADRSRHHEHPGQHHSAAMLPPSTSSNSEHKRQHARAPDHSVHKKLLQEQEQEELLVGERLMHVRPRYSSALTPIAGSKGSTNDTATVVRGPGKAKQQQQRKHPQPLSIKAQKLAKATSQANKAHGAAKSGGLAGSSFTKEYKGHRATKKYNPKKHSWKKAQHKDKLLRNRQGGKRDVMKKNKDGSLTTRANTKKEKAANKEIMKAKELLRKEKALKKKERREKRAKIMAYRKRE